MASTHGMLFVRVVMRNKNLIWEVRPNEQRNGKGNS